MWLLAIPAVVAAWFLLIYALATAIDHNTTSEADDRRMIRHLRDHYPEDPT